MTETGMKNLIRSTLFGCAFALALAGCGKSPSPEAPPQAAAPVEQTFARDTPDAGKVEYVSITANGRGATVATAVDQAIKLAIQQVNGKTMDMSALQFQAGMTVAVGDDTVDVGSAAFAEFVATQSRGAVTGFKVLSQKQLENGEAEVSIEAQVAKFAKPESAGKLRVAVMPFRANDSGYVVDTQRVAADGIVQDLRGSITNTLVKTGRVTVLDREFGAEVQSEIDLLETGRMSTDDFARLGEQLLAEYVIVGRIDHFGYERHERQLRTSDRTLVSHSGGASISFRVINATTGQIELSDAIAIELPPTTATTLGTSVNASAVTAQLVGQLSSQAANAIVMRLFPLTIVAVDGANVVLSQGGSMVSVGDRYDVVQRGKEITDPQTGRVIGRVESPCCTIEVTRVTPEMSYAKVLKAEIDVAQAFAPGALEISGPSRNSVADSVASEPASRSTAEPDASVAVSASTQSATASEHDALPAAGDDPNW
jgi:curli biogenesis system outer membrane secretion channel CsgG/predicted small lipoprotein YifL